jgi:hypothetical protein
MIDPIDLLVCQFDIPASKKALEESRPVCHENGAGNRHQNTVAPAAYLKKLTRKLAPEGIGWNPLNFQAEK